MPEHINIMTVGELIVFSVVLIVTGILFVLFCMAPEEKGSSMLVLTRNPEPHRDTILIGPDIRIRILAVIGDKVKIGIEAPRNVTVIRGELAAEPVVGANVPQAFKPLTLEESAAVVDSRS